MKTITEKELDVLFPTNEVELIDGHTFTIKPFSFVQTSIVAKKLAPIFNIFFIDNIDQTAIVKLMGESYEGIRDVIAMVYNISPKLVDRFDQATALKAISHIIEINKSFFENSVEQQVTEIMTQMNLDSKSEK